MDYEQNKIFRDEMAKFIDQYDWQIWFTGTFKPEKPYYDTIKTKGAFTRFLNFLTREYNKTDIEYCLAIERFKLSDDTHCHALINNLDGLTYEQIGEAWRSLYGRERVEGYQKGKGANYYLTKYVTKDLCDWDLRINNNKQVNLIF